MNNTPEYTRPMDDPEITLFSMVLSEEERYLIEIRSWLRQTGVRCAIETLDHSGAPVLVFGQYDHHENGFGVFVNHEGPSESWTLNIVPFHAREFPKLPWNRPITAAYLIYRYIIENIEESPSNRQQR